MTLRWSNNHSNLFFWKHAKSRFKTFIWHVAVEICFLNGLKQCWASLYVTVVANINLEALTEEGEEEEDEWEDQSNFGRLAPSYMDEDDDESSQEEGQDSVRRRVVTMSVFILSDCCHTIYNYLLYYLTYVLSKREEVRPVLLQTFKAVMFSRKSSAEITTVICCLLSMQI